ncbi:TniQ family protein [Burkholderia contaminans]|uniref:TniQ family protein n=1 Tax=Burkholderia contaminans TaxID=488447 RepID=UPI000F595F62|nr:TniQ family protein [Burkholderia contaminans]
MINYPSINWWPGNLRRYEAGECFVARFCDQNGISTSQAIKYIGMGAAHIGLNANKEIMHVSSVLREDTTVVATVLRPLLRAPAFEMRHYPSIKRGSHILRICPECIANGYYSNFHEMKWIGLCPLHDCELVECCPNGSGATIFEDRVSRLQGMLRSSCNYWPASGTRHPIRITNAAKRITEWLSAASDEMVALSENQIWTNGSQDEDLINLLGRAKRLVPIEKNIEKYLVDRYALWHIERQDFGAEVKNRINELQLASDFSFEYSYYFYKCLGGSEASGVDFLENVRRERKKIELRHGACNCQWKYFKGRWRKSELLDDYEWPERSMGKCPFQMALSMWDEAWGMVSDSFSNRDLRQYALEMTQLSRLMHNADLIFYAPDANLSPEGLLCLSKNPLSYCRWNSESMLAGIFKCAALWEVELLSTVLNKWLDSMNKESPPPPITWSRDRICLFKTSEGVALMKWVKII